MPEDAHHDDSSNSSNNRLKIRETSNPRRQRPGVRGYSQQGHFYLPCIFYPFSYSLYHLNGLLFTTHTSFLLDTGAAVSLLSRALWERVKPDGAELQPGISRQLVSLGHCGAVQGLKIEGTFH